MLIKFKKSQATAEYAILFALVVAAAMGVQTYVKRSLQSAIKQRADWFVRTVVDGDTTVVQWEAQDGTKNTHFQNSERIYTEDPEQDEPFHYEENMSSDYDSLIIQ